MSLMTSGKYVISAELLSGALGPRQIVTFDRWLSERFDRIDYVIYVRDPVDWVLSYYNQQVRIGSTESLHSFCNRFNGNAIFNRIEKWRSSVGLDRLHVRLLESDWMTGGDLLSDFSDFLGVPIEKTQIPRRRNESLDLRDVEVLQCISRACERLPFGAAQMFRDTYLLAPKPRRRPQNLKLTQEQINTIVKANTHQCETLRRQFFPERNSLFPRHFGR